MIPKIIWQTHEWNWDNLPEKLKIQSNTWKDKNSNWKHEYCSKEQRLEHMKKFGKKYLDTYLLIPNKMMQADFWRYCVVYHFGGMYIDMDTICRENNFLDTWIDLDKELVGSGNYDKDNSITNDFFAAERRSKFLEGFIDLVINNIEEAYKSNTINSSKIIDTTTGPLIWSTEIKKYMHDSNRVQLGIKITTGNQFKSGPGVLVLSKLGQKDQGSCICCGRPF